MLYLFQILFFIFEPERCVHTVSTNRPPPPRERKGDGLPTFPQLPPPPTPTALATTPIHRCLTPTTISPQNAFLSHWSLVSPFPHSLQPPRSSTAEERNTIYKSRGIVIPLPRPPSLPPVCPSHSPRGDISRNNGEAQEHRDDYDIYIASIGLSTTPQKSESLGWPYVRLQSDSKSRRRRNQIPRR